MRQRSTLRRMVAKFLVVCLTAVGLTVVGSVASPTPALALGGTTPVYFVHGVNPLVPLQYSDCAGWDSLINFARAAGWQGDANTVGYYSGDQNCTTNLGVGGASNPIGYFAKKLAWDIYNEYTRDDIPVVAVGHSMGGLIIRTAIDGAQRGLTGYPPPIMVTTAITLSTPHKGSDYAYGCAGWNVQCQQMIPGSAFMQKLATYAWHPQGLGGTQWIVVGSDADAIVTRASAKGMGADYKVIYNDTYGHLDIWTDGAIDPMLSCDVKSGADAWSHTMCYRVGWIAQYWL